MLSKYLFSKENKKIINLLNPGNKNFTKFVGGCVRKALNKKIDFDIDLASFLSSQKLREILQKNNYKIVSFAKRYGTIAVVVGKYKYEISTLRKDIKTYGRQADIERTENWFLDASRRDFTINAIYVDKYGKIFDPFNGTKDLQNNLVCFIGDPVQRIKEDYLRAIRFIRFSLEYRSLKANRKIFLILKKNLKNIRKLSSERLYNELKKIFKLKNSFDILKNKEFIFIIKKVYNLDFFNSLKKIKFFNTIELNYKIIIATLLIGKKNIIYKFVNFFKISREDKNYLHLLSQEFFNKKKIDSKYLKLLIYKYGYKKSNDVLIFLFLKDRILSFSKFKKLLKSLNKLKKPKFPINGNTFLKIGIKQGPTIGKLIKKYE
ncbi:MAG: hypothetical protein ACKO3E_03460, partial [Candidatus Fonsibacter sp.]